MNSHFERRATRQEFASSKFLVYINFAIVVNQKEPIVTSLLRYGTDVLYAKFLWPDKLQLLDTVNRLDMPFKQKVFNKVGIDIMLADYSTLLMELNLEGIISMIAHFKTSSSAEMTKQTGRAELWVKLQMLLVKAFEVRHANFEHAEKEEEEALPLDKDSIMLLASVLIASETTGHLRDPLVINYLFKSVFELVDFDSQSYQKFSLQDISILIDAYYKSQMPLTDKYGDLFFDILDKQKLLNQASLETQPVKQTLRLFRGFAHLQEGGISASKKQQMLELLDKFARSEVAVKETTPTMWLSVFDVAENAEMAELRSFAHSMFYQTFDWQSLFTAAEENSQGQGRRTKS